MEANDHLMTEVFPVVQRSCGQGSYEEAEVYYYHAYCLFMHWQANVEKTLRLFCSDPVISVPLGVGTHPEAIESGPASESEEDIPPLVWEYLEFARVRFLEEISEERSLEPTKEFVASTNLYLGHIHLLLGLLKLEEGESANALEEFRQSLDFSKTAVSDRHPLLTCLCYTMGQALSMSLETVTSALEYLEMARHLLSSPSTDIQDDVDKLLPLTGFCNLTDIPLTKVTETIEELKVLTSTPDLLDLLMDDQKPKPKSMDREQVVHDLGVVGGMKQSREGPKVILFSQEKKRTNSDQKRKRKRKPDSPSSVPKGKRSRK
jgi:hypothetical protein